MHAIPTRTWRWCGGRRGLGAHFDLFGGVLWNAPDLAPCVEAEGLFTRLDDGSIVQVSINEVEQIESCAAIRPERACS